MVRNVCPTLRCPHNTCSWTKKKMMMMTGNKRLINCMNGLRSWRPMTWPCRIKQCHPLYPQYEKKDRTRGLEWGVVKCKKGCKRNGCCYFKEEGFGREWVIIGRKGLGGGRSDLGKRGILQGKGVLGRREDWKENGWLYGEEGFWKVMGAC